MEYYFTEQFGNPHSPHELGTRAMRAIEDARKRIAIVLGGSPRQIIFTSGGTEANNMAILGGARARKNKGNHLLTTPIEHKSILGPMGALEREGFKVDFLPVDSTGMIDPQQLENFLLKETVLVSVGHANNEIGTVQPLEEIAPVLRAKGILLHSDAVQSFGKVPVRIADLGVDLLSISGHKIYGPKGIGVLYMAPGIRLEPLLYGGDQERGLRPGTLNVPAIMGLAKAVELAAEEMDQESSRLKALRDELITRALLIDGVYLNGHRSERLPNNVNLGVSGIEGQIIVAELARRNIAISTGAACSSGSKDPSHVLTALGQGREQAYEGFRITLGRNTSMQEILQLVTSLSEVIKDLSDRFKTRIFADSV